jgi:hypothetical protein
LPRRHLTRIVRARNEPRKNHRSGNLSDCQQATCL